jgi:Sec-independent protein secretion pathway component TatC
VAKTAAYDDIVGNLQNRAWMYFLLAAIVFASVFYIVPDIIEWLSDRLLPEDATLIYLSPAEYLILKMRVAGYAAISATAMIAMIHIWRIIRSRSMLPEISFTDLVLIFVIALLLFSMGMLYSLELMLPTVLEYLQNDAAQAGLETTYSLSAFYHFVFLLGNYLPVASCDHADAKTGIDHHRPTGSIPQSSGSCLLHYGCIDYATRRDLTIPVGGAFDGTI